MAAESKTGCFLNFPKKSLSGQALPPPPPPPDRRDILLQLCPASA